MEGVAHFLQLEQKCEFHFEIRKAIEQTPKSNISPAEKQAICELKNNDHINILPDDKGRLSLTNRTIRCPRQRGLLS